MNQSGICEDAIEESAFSLEIHSFIGHRESRWNGAEIVGGVRTILLVEDETFVREVAGEVLRTAGYRVLTAKNAAEAMDIYNEAHCDIDLLLTDVILPGETGRALADRLRRENPLLPVLLATGYGDQMARETGEECLAKPFASEELLRRVSELMEATTRRAGIMSRRLASPRGLQDMSWNLT